VRIEASNLFVIHSMTSRIVHIGPLLVRQDVAGSLVAHLGIGGCKDDRRPPLPSPAPICAPIRAKINLEDPELSQSNCHIHHLCSAPPPREEQLQAVPKFLNLKTKNPNVLESNFSKQVISPHPLVYVCMLALSHAFSAPHYHTYT
jgi:hypothetical protein